jgi:hypothetical protein
MSVRGESERVAKPLPTEFVTGNYFSIFGIRPFAGRLLSVARCSSPLVVVLSRWRQAHCLRALWSEELGSASPCRGGHFSGTMRAIGCHDTGATRSRNLTHRRTA